MIENNIGLDKIETYFNEIEDIKMFIGYDYPQGLKIGDMVSWREIEWSLETKKHFGLIYNFKYVLYSRNPDIPNYKFRMNDVEEKIFVMIRGVQNKEFEIELNWISLESSC
jgi:hypothetical protein